MPKYFPAQQSSLNYLTEGGHGTEIMYKYGFDLPHFAMFPLLDDPRAVTELRGMYRRYLDTAARNGFGVMIGGFDYRVSPDWGSLLGYAAAAVPGTRISTRSRGTCAACGDAGVSPQAVGRQKP